MTKKQSTDDRVQPTDIGRRTFIAVGSGLGATTLAGCTSDGSTDGTRTDESTDETQTEDGMAADSDDDGSFRLLISDMPADIGDFDRLDVTLDYARIFDGGANGDDESADEGGESDDAAADATDDEEEPTDDGETDADESPDDGEPESEPDSNSDSDEDGAERTRDFYTLDLEGATVDLTAVVGDKAVPVFDGGLSPGTYEKIELHVSSVEGIVNGARANVKVPSEKLQLTHPFEVRADDPVDFVFDINVVKRGNGNDYNLKPVISESGVAGKDVDVEEVANTRDDEKEGRNGESDSDGGAPDDEDGRETGARGDSSGNETEDDGDGGDDGEDDGDGTGTGDSE